MAENLTGAEMEKQRRFFELAEQFRAATAEEDVQRLGNELGRLVFGG